PQGKRRRRTKCQPEPAWPQLRTAWFSTRSSTNWLAWLFSSASVQLVNQHAGSLDDEHGHHSAGEDIVVRHLPFRVGMPHERVGPALVEPEPSRREAAQGAEKRAAAVALADLHDVDIRQRHRNRLGMIRAPLPFIAARIVVVITVAVRIAARRIVG